MSIKDDLIGSKGGSSTFRNRPDNLRSTDTFEALIGLCSGRIKGLAPGGLQNLMVDDVPIEDGSGNSTLKDFNAVLFDGDPSILQPIQLQLGGSSGAQNLNLPLNNANQGAGTGTPGDYRFGTVTQAGVDYIDLRFVINSLYRQDKKGIYDATASIEIELQPSGSSQWINPLLNLSAPTYNASGQSLSGYSGVILYAMKNMYNPNNLSQWADSAPGFLQVTGKTTQAYVKELRIAVPNTGNYANKTWQVRARLRERDSYTADENQESRSIQWESIAGVSMAPIGNREEWRGLSYLHVTGKASDQLSGVPTITGTYDLSMVRVPPASVWNASTRVYTSNTWDGATEEVQWTQCPAFQMKDLIEDSVSGISALVPGSTMNKWDVLEASKWFAQRVPNGKGGTHARYSMNYLLDSALSVNDLMQYVAGAVGGYAWDEGDSKWRLIVEKPENASALFTKENIVGEFNYAHTDIDSRFNDMIGVFRNEERNFEEDRVRVFDQPHIDGFGRRATSIALVGCTNRQEALRRIKIRQLTSLNETRQVSFVTNRQGCMVQPFSVILVADGDLASTTEVRTTGRIISRTSTTVTLRDTIRLEVGITYKMHVTVPNPAYNPDSTVQPTSPDWRKPTITITRGITNTTSNRGDVRVLTFSGGALPSNTPENANIAFEAVGLPTLPKQYRVLDVEYQDEELVSINAIEIYTNKWTESDNVDESAILAQRPNKFIPPPTTPVGGMFSIKSFQGDVQIKTVMTVRWDRPASIWVDGFKVEFNLNNGPWQTLAEKTQDNYVELQQPLNGLYNFRIATLDRRGGISQPLLGEYTYDSTLEGVGAAYGLGPLADRPSNGAQDGELYTTTDQYPNVTYLWKNGQWNVASSYVDEAGQIHYGDGTSVESQKPSEPGATNGANPNSPMGPDGQTVRGVLTDIDINAETSVLWSFKEQQLRDYVNDKLYVDGKPVNTVIVQESYERVEGQKAIAQTIKLIGAVNDTGEAFNLNFESLLVDQDRSLGLVLSELTSTSNGHTASISNLYETVVTPNGSAAKAMFLLGVDDKVVGYTATNDGRTGRLVFSFDSVEIQGPDGIPIFTADSATKTVFMPNVVVDTLKANTVDTKHLVQSSAAKTSFLIVNSDMSISRGTTATVVTLSFSKAEPDSVVEVVFFGTFESADDLQFEGTFVMDGTSYLAGRVNIILDTQSSQGSMPMTPFRFFSGLGTGQHTISFLVKNNEVDNIPLTIKGGATLKVTELKKAMI